tara:strand:+ start:64 stop:477 length:414 start_codon:yes stop_codon:yes gene_type:complete
MKTVPNRRRSVQKFVDGAENERRRTDATTLLALMRKVTGAEPVLWGDSIVGFGSYHYKYASAREGDFMRTGFSPRKQHTVVYVMPGFGRYNELMGKLGKYRTGNSCLYINKLDDVDMNVLERLVREAWKHMAKAYPD